MNHPYVHHPPGSSPKMSILRHILLLLLLLFRQNILTSAVGGKWVMLNSNIGVSAMHMQLLNTDRVVIFDRTSSGRSNISLPPGRKCLKNDCTAHSVEYDVASNSVRPLAVLTDTWCSSGAVFPDGTLVQTGGWGDGDRNVRMYRPCTNRSCDWQEISGGLSQRRWYATNQILPDGGQIVIGGRGQYNYEFYPKTSSASTSYNLPFLAQTYDYRVENNLYPFVFLNKDGNLFIYVNNRAILLDYKHGTVVKTYPTVPGGDPRNYPSSGSAVLLPLKNSVGAEVLVCGGAPKGAYDRAEKGDFTNALNTCGRIRIDDPRPQWEMETMPMGRVMGDMVLLSDGNVLIVNGAGSGTAGWGLGRNPVLTPVIYRPNYPKRARFQAQSPGSRPRVYHSTAILLRDCRVLIGGSNTNKRYVFKGVLFPTDLTLEAFSPPYLNRRYAYLRPRIVRPSSHSRIGYGQQLPIRFAIPPGRLNNNSVMVTMVSPSFSTHSFSMNQRLLILTFGDLRIIAKSTYQIRVATPGSGNLAPSGYYLLFVVHQGIPSEGIWVRIQ